MKSGDSLNVRKDSIKVEVKQQEGSLSFPITLGTYESTYFPELLSISIDHGRYDITKEALQSILPSNIMSKAMEKAHPETASFQFYNTAGVAHAPIEAPVSPSPADSLSATLVSPVPQDSLALVARDSLIARPAIDSLATVHLAREPFSFSDLDSSLLGRFGLPELISRDSYILLESHPELVYGNFSIKTQAVIPAKVGEATPRETQNLGVLSFAVLTIGMIFFIISLKFQFKHVRAIFLSLISFHEARKTYESRSLGFKRFSTLSTLFFLLTMTVFAVLVAQKFAGNFVQDFGILPTYILSFVVIGALQFLKILTVNILSAISRQRELFEELKFNQVLVTTAAAILLFPLQVVASYVDAGLSLIFIYVSIYLAAIVLANYILRSLRLFLSHRVSFFFWFLYFCTLEMLPIAVALFLLG